MTATGAAKSKSATVHCGKPLEFNNSGSFDTVSHSAYLGLAKAHVVTMKEERVDAIIKH